MVQTLVLMKSPGTGDLLHRLQAEGVLRASAAAMTGCYSALGVAEGPVSKPLVYATSAEGCNPPSDMDCTLAELIAWINKVSGWRELEYVSFALVTVAPEHLPTYSRSLQELGFTEPTGDSYVAAARVMGCGPQNVLLEVMSNDADRMLEMLSAMTDVAGVIDVQVLRVHPEDTRGFGSGSDTAA